MNPGSPGLPTAAATNDALAEEHGVEYVISNLGLDLSDLRYIAEQRALRAVLVRGGRLDDLKRYNQDLHAKAVELSDEERAEVNALIPAYWDGITIGARWAQKSSLRP